MSTSLSSYPVFSFGHRRCLSCSVRRSGARSWSASLSSIRPEFFPEKNSGSIEVTTSSESCSGSQRGSTGEGLRGCFAPCPNHLLSLSLSFWFRYLLFLYAQISFSLYLSIYLFVYLSIYLSIYPFSLTNLSLSHFDLALYLFSLTYLSLILILLRLLFLAH